MAVTSLCPTDFDCPQLDGWCASAGDDHRIWTECCDLYADEPPDWVGEGYRCLVFNDYLASHYPYCTVFDEWCCDYDWTSCAIDCGAWDCHSCDFVTDCGQVVDCLEKDCGVQDCGAGDCNYADGGCPPDCSGGDCTAVGDCSGGDCLGPGDCGAADCVAAGDCTGFDCAGAGDCAGADCGGANDCTGADCVVSGDCSVAADCAGASDCIGADCGGAGDCSGEDCQGLNDCEGADCVVATDCSGGDCVAAGDCSGGDCLGAGDCQNADCQGLGDCIGADCGAVGDECIQTGDCSGVDCGGPGDCTEADCHGAGDCVGYDCQGGSDCGAKDCGSWDLCTTHDCHKAGDCVTSDVCTGAFDSTCTGVADCGIHDYCDAQTDTGCSAPDTNCHNAGDCGWYDTCGNSCDCQVGHDPCPQKNDPTCVLYEGGLCKAADHSLCDPVDACAGHAEGCTGGAGDCGTVENGCGTAESGDCGETDCFPEHGVRGYAKFFADSGKREIVAMDGYARVAIMSLAEDLTTDMDRVAVHVPDWIDGNAPPSDTYAINPPTDCIPDNCAIGDIVETSGFQYSGLEGDIVIGLLSPESLGYLIVGISSGGSACATVTADHWCEYQEGCGSALDW